LKALPKDQALSHAQFGIGIVKSSDDDRTVIDFYEHGQKKFVTSMLQAQLLAEAPPKPGKSKSKSKAKTTTRKKKATKATAAK